jgi:ABC-type uncharacterized transport system
MSARTFDAATRKRLWVGLLLVLALVLLLSAMRFIRTEEPPVRPRLGLMTSLPLLWSEGGIEADLAAEAKPHPAFARLAQNYDIKPIDDLTALSPNAPSLLLLVQPRALSPAELVKLDAWVRQGGRVLILADPALQWGSLYSLGDKRRPLFTSLLSPLFSYWGIELVLPIADDQPLAIRDVDKLTIRTQTPGEWQVKAGSGVGLCVIAPNRLVADCKIGKGRALLVADADLLDTAYWSGQGVRAMTGADEFGNMQWIEALLLALRDGRKNAGDFVGK